ncbi:MAG: FecR domain-containing protein [Reyranella sp.]|nr:FecR domain-containing protein [Reyranella sp.]
MAKPAFVSSSLPRAALAGATALMLLCSPMMIGTAAAKVGVTSATDGDPLGKPPTEAERVLRVGVDVQANETITTKAGDRAHLMFLDGTSLTVGPDASLVIDKFVYDPNSKTGDLAITASKGVFRLVGGKISKTNAIVVNTPSDTIGIRGGIAMLDVNQAKTRSIFLFGFSMTVGANGRIETITRPGTEVTTSFGSLPGRPTLLTRGQLTALLGQFEGSKKGGTPGGSGNADQAAKNSGFSDGNSSKGTGVDGSKGDKFGSGPGPGNRNPNDQIINALTQSDGLRLPGQVQNIVNTANAMTSTVTYKGTMSGVAVHNGNPSLASGTYQNVWNVGARNGVASAQFNGASFGGGSTPNTFAVGNSSVFTTAAPLPSTTGVPGRSLSLIGTTSPTSQVGAFVITGPRYGANGTFQSTKQ